MKKKAKTTPKKVEVSNADMEFHIMKETKVPYVVLDVVMSPKLYDNLIAYAHLKMTAQERDELYLNWAVRTLLLKATNSDDKEAQND